ncbi:MAG TPA: WD40 repeat domain-containing protein, partial [Candidatus Limnocylindrales bacterium]|nr:WD40 repeat domain-containing protein [Candidatus Limnocylindrales bacterium]
MERFGVPWYRWALGPARSAPGPARPVKAGRLRPLRVFRDDVDLAASPGLWPDIEQALESSRWFILLAAPAAAASPWVRREVAWWLEHRSPERILIAWTAGDLAWRSKDFDWRRTDALPRNLARVFTDEPHWVDLRPVRPSMENASVTGERLRLGDLVAEFAAPVRGTAKDSLVGAHVRQRKLARRTVIAVAAALLTLALTAATGAIIAGYQRNLAVARGLEVREQLRNSQSRQVATASDRLFETQPDVSMLLSVVAMRIAPTEQARSAVLNTQVQPYMGALVGHGGRVVDLAVSPDRQTLATGSMDKTVRLWDLRARQSTATLSGHTDRVWSVAFDRTGELVASASWDGTVRIWQAANGTERGQPLRGHDGPVLTVAFSPTEDLLASAGRDGTVRLWDPRTGAALGILADLPMLLSGLAFHPDGHMLAAGAQDGSVHLWRLPTRTELPALRGHSSAVEALAFSPDGQSLASTSLDHTGVVWDVVTQRQKFALLGHDREVESVAFSRDGSRIATGSQDHTVRIWRADNGAFVTRLAGQTFTVSGVAFGADADTLISAGLDTAAALWDLRRGMRVRHAESVLCAAYSPDGKILATGGFDQTVRLWDSHTGEPVATITTESNIGGVAFSPDGAVLVTAGFGSVQFWDTATHASLGGLPVHSNAGGLAVFSHDGGLLAIGSDNPAGSVLDNGSDDVVQIWRVSTRELVRTLNVGSGLIRSIAFSRDDKHLAVAGQVAQIWDVESGTRIRTLAQQYGLVDDVALSRDDHLLAVSVSDASVKVWDVGSGRLKLTLGGFGQPVGPIAFNHGANNGGDRLAAASDDGLIRLWDSASWSPLATLAGHTEVIGDIAFAPDDEHLVSANSDGTALIWDLDLDRVIQRLCGLLTYDLDPATWQRFVPAEVAYRPACGP